ncbi:MAG TPA: dihydrolipoamide acetyltransferase family protein [Puia sp.]|jgi:2-oxoglutarate dehydrogenase E2 component (dihydrolipoamide succinyltransferase)|nr:dihydrolipoamide acetyltransferase family protein [Puia sp.]
MALVDLIMPKMGESIMEATILKWHKQPGDKVNEDETVLEIATDKVDTEVPSTAQGTVEELLFKVNDVVPVGAAIARIRTGASETVVVQSPPPHEIVHEAKSLSGSNGKQATMSSNRFYSPLVLNIASNEGLAMSELEKIPGTGNEGRVTKQDILQYLSAKGSANAGDTEYKFQETGNKAQEITVIPRPHALEQQSTTSYSGNVEIVEMDRMRKLIAHHMVSSQHTSAHVTSFTESDVTNLVLWREKSKMEFEKREGTKITFTPLFIEAVVRCIKKYPLINSSVDGDKIILKKDIHIGMATALPNGNLIVPVIKNADQLNLVGLAKQVNNLADNARTNKLRPEDTQGGTFTLTNVGTFGSLMGTPIINQPQVAILAVGAIKKRPVVIETSQGDSIAIRHMMYLSLSYDHRIIDGSLGATFLTAVANELQNFNPERDF